MSILFYASMADSPVVTVATCSICVALTTEVSIDPQVAAFNAYSCIDSSFFTLVPGLCISIDEARIYSSQAGPKPENLPIESS